MVPGVNIEDVKRYNAELKMYQDKAAQIKAGIEYSNKEIERLCAELSAELGVTVTVDNIAAIREERLAKIENTLQVGNDILNRIKAEEAQANSTVQPATQPVVSSASPFTQAPANMGFSGVTPQAPQAPQAPSMGQAPQAPVFGSLGDIPSIFSK